MVIFNRNFLFLDEISLNNTHNKVFENIQVSKEDIASIDDFFTLQSAWVLMTDRRVRYYGNEAFEDSSSVDEWALEVEGVVTLIWQGKTNTIRYIKGEKYTAELLQFWVLHTFFPLVLELAKLSHILHVSAVEINEKPILFSAFSGGGKSTLLNYFLKQGHRIYGDDTVAIEEIDGSYKVVASYPFHRPYRKAEVLGYPIDNFATEVKPLYRVYRLDKSSETSKIKIEELHGVEKFETLYQSQFVTFENLTKSRYNFATKMAQQVQVFTISVPWDMERLEEVYQALLIHNEI
ncbi:MAG TPA: hypothetical protein ENJ34_00105 [Epsilonproteobacteria bacterium]|nr:hypothetical protein [Campylobacterota bacterium]